VLAVIVIITGRCICSANSYCDIIGGSMCSVIRYCDNNGEVYV
jgi:hypothetical protein